MAFTAVTVLGESGPRTGDLLPAGGEHLTEPEPAGREHETDGDAHGLPAP